MVLKRTGNQKILVIIWIFKEVLQGIIIKILSIIDTIV